MVTLPTAVYHAPGMNDSARKCNRTNYSVACKWRKTYSSVSENENSKIFSSIHFVDLETDTLLLDRRFLVHVQLVIKRIIFHAPPLFLQHFYVLTRTTGCCQNTRYLLLSRGFVFLCCQKIIYRPF
jgi:hypothetical protein